MTTSRFPKTRGRNLRYGLATAATIAAAAAFVPTASAADCVGLDCPGVNLQSVEAHGALPALTPAEVESTTASGFFDVGTKGEAGRRQVAYIASYGTWEAAPAEIRSKFASALSANDMATRKIVIAGPGTIATYQAPKSALSATAAATAATSSLAAYDGCNSGWFCVWDGGSGTGDRYQWADVGVWQGMGGGVNRASSMKNRRTGWSLLKRNDGRNYCARPISEDSSLSNNGFNNNTASTYNSASDTQSGAWNCAN